MWSWSPEMVHNSYKEVQKSRPAFWFVLLSRSFYCFRRHGYWVIINFSYCFFSQSQILSRKVQACYTFWTMASRIPPSSHIPPTNRNESRSCQDNFIPYPATKIFNIKHPALILGPVPHPAKPILDPLSLSARWGVNRGVSRSLRSH